MILTMSTAIHHAMSSAKKFGGEPDDYLAIHEFFDQFKNQDWHFAHRVVLHHTGGIEIAEQVFGAYIRVKTRARKEKKDLSEEREEITMTISALENLEPNQTNLSILMSLQKKLQDIVMRENFHTKSIPVRWIGEQHMKEDFGFVPTPADWTKSLKEMKGLESWMLTRASSAQKLGVAE